jgi:hypothetical protein
MSFIQHIYFIFCKQEHSGHCSEGVQALNLGQGEAAYTLPSPKKHTEVKAAM